MLTKILVYGVLVIQIYLGQPFSFINCDTLIRKIKRMVMYDANDDEVHHINYGKLDGIDDNLFTIQHPEPYVRPNIALNLSNNQIAELRGVCFSDSFNIPQKNDNKPSCCASKQHIFDKICVLKITVSIILVAGWALLVAGIVKQSDVNEREGWMFLTLMFIILIITTMSLKRLLSRCQNKFDATSDPYSCKRIFCCISCLKSTKDEEESILYSLKT